MYKYNFAARGINENADYQSSIFTAPEYNFLDALRFNLSLGKYQEPLVMETFEHPISDLVTTLELPVYFVMGKYDGMTSPEAAQTYLNNLSGMPTRELVLFDQSAHYPQFEEEEAFNTWMCNTFLSK